MHINRRIFLPLLLILTLLCGCGGTGAVSQSPQQAPAISQPVQQQAPAVQEQDVPDPAPVPEQSAPEESAPEQSAPDAVTSATPEAPPPVEPEQAVISDQAHTCTISISCAAILDNLDSLPPEKAPLVPDDGWLLPPTAVTFYEGESVFNVLQRTCKQQKLHLEFEDTPLYNSAYIEGICNLYEFDCGDLSGWMYQVNGIFPNYGSSRYQLQDGDVICWEYTCDLGADVNGRTARQG